MKITMNDGKDIEVADEDVLIKMCATFSVSILLPHPVLVSLATDMITYLFVTGQNVQAEQFGKDLESLVKKRMEQQLDSLQGNSN